MAERLDLYAGSREAELAASPAVSAPCRKTVRRSVRRSTNASSMVRLAGRHGEQRSVARERYSLIDELNHRDRDRLGIGVRRQTTADDFGCDHHHRQTLVGDERALVFGF